MHCILFNLSLFAMPLSLSRPHLGRVVSNYCWSNNISGDAGPSSAGPEHKSVRGLATESKLCFFFLFIMAGLKQALLALLRLRRQDGSAADVNICTLNLFFLPSPPFKLFTNSAVVKGHKARSQSSQLKRCLYATLSLPLPMSSGWGVVATSWKMNSLTCGCGALLLCDLSRSVRLRGNKGQSEQFSV